MKLEQIKKAIENWCGEDDAPGALTWKEWEAKGWHPTGLKSNCPEIRPADVCEELGIGATPANIEEVERACDAIWCKAIEKAGQIYT